MSETRVPAIPAPTDDNLRDVARAVKGVLDVREGLLGDPLDANVTFRTLKDGGIIDVTTIKRGGGSGTVVVTPPAGTDSGTTYDPVTDLTTPPMPTGFAVTGLFAAVKLSWTAQTTMRNYAYTEVWRSTTSALGAAVRIGSSVAPMYLDYVGNGVTYYYWVRFVSQASVSGPYNSTVGTEGKSSPDPAYLLDVLTDKITTDQLLPALETRINLIDGPDTTTGSVNARVKVVQDIASVKNRTFYSAAEPLSTTAAPLTLGDLWFKTDDNNKPRRWDGTAWQLVTDTRVGQLVTDLSTETTSRVNGDLAETRRRDALYAASFAGTGNSYKIFVQETQPVGTQIGDIWSWVNTTTGAVTFSRYNGSVWVDSSGNKRAAVYMGASSSPPASSIVIGDLYFDIEDKKVYVFNGSAWVPKVTAMPDVAAFVYSEQIARVEGDDALAQTISTVSATKTRSYWQTSAPTGTTQIPLVEGDLWFDTDDNNRVYRWSGSQWQSGRDGTIAIVDARVSNVETAKIGYCKINNLATDHTDRVTCEAAGGTWVVGLPLATAVKQVSVTDGSTTATLEQRFTAQKDTNNTLLAKYTVKIDIAGHVTGFGLASTTNTDAPISEFGVRADSFFIAPPSFSSAVAPTSGNYKGRAWINTSVTPNVTRYWNGTAWVADSPALPFVVNNAAGTINGVTVPAGVYIDTAFIGDATIKKAQIGSVYADRIEAGYTTSVDLESAKFYGSEFYIGGAVTYEYNDPLRPTQKTGIAGVTGYNIGLTPTGAEFDVGYFKIKNGATLTTPFEVVNNVVRITRAAIGIITANEIDSRNLSIKDAAGNVVFSAESGLGAANLKATAGGVNLLVNSTFRAKYSNPNNANDPEIGRPLNYGPYNNANVARQWVTTDGFTDTSSFALRCRAWTASQFGLWTDTRIQENNLSGGVFGGWKPNTTYVISFRAKAIRATLLFNFLQSAVTAAATTLTLQDASQFPAPAAVNGGYWVFFTDGDESTWEGMFVYAKSGNTLSVIRAQSGVAINRAAGARVQIGFTNIQYGWNTAPLEQVDVSNPVLSASWQRYARRIRWGDTTEPFGAVYLSMFGTKRDGEEIHIDELQVQEGDVVTAWGPSERDSVGELNPITPSNVSTYVGADAIGVTQLGTTLQTTNFSATAGWQIKKDGTATFNSVKVRGEINGGAFTEFAWPAAGQSGFHLGPNGLALGNANDGKYFLVESNGNVTAPGLKIVNGVLSIGQAGVINTLNIAGSAVTVSTYAEGYLPTLTLGTSNVDVCGTSITISGLSTGQTAGTILTANIVLYEGGGEAAVVLGTIFVNGAAVGQAACTLGDSKTMTANAFVNLPNGTHTIQVRIRVASESGGASSKTVTALGYITAISGKR